MIVMRGEAAAVVSVVMSVFNDAHQLPSTMESILGQRDVALELIVIDDGSTDESGRILDSFAQRDARVRVIHQENRGLTRALIRGCLEARASYVARHDSGDTSDPDRLRKQKAVLDANPEVVFVSCWTNVVGPNDELLFIAPGTGSATEPRSILDANAEWGVSAGPSSHPSVMFRADAYRDAGGYRAEFYYGQDWDLWYRLAERGKFQMIPEALYTTRVDLRTISSSARGAQSEFATLSLAAMKARAAGNSDADVLKLATNVQRKRKTWFSEARGLYFIGEALRRNGDERARAYLMRAVRSCPLHAKAWLRLAQTFFP